MGKELKYSQKFARVLRFSSAYICVCSTKVQRNKTKPLFWWSGITGLYHCNVGVMFRVVQRDILHSCYVIC